MLGNRYSQHSFAQIPAVNMARSSFDRSHTVKDTWDFDYLYPIFCDEIIPGDTCNLNVNTFARLATQVVPVMDNMYIDYFFFFVPNRLVWDNWEKLCGAQDNPGDTTDYIVPTITTSNTTQAAVGTIFDKFGIPTGISGVEFNALPFRSYNLIWNTWFRDQNLQDSLDVYKDDGPDLATEYTLKKRGKRHDYFTSCLPWPQKGTAIDLPLGTSAPVKTNSTAVQAYLPDIPGDSALKIDTNGHVYTNNVPVAIRDFKFGTESGLYADLTNATAATINQLREAWQVQSILELDARGGTRYVEILQAHFNVTSPDFRLQRPEYLGGGQSRINCHPVPQTSSTSGSNYQGNLASFGTSSTSGNSVGFTKSFVEHGYVIGLACARADITYQQGLNRMWSKSTRYDFFWPKLQEIGEQAVLSKEIYTGGVAADDDVFGYQERYAEYRYKPSEIRGEFRSTYASSIDQWHLAEEFATRPELNDTFIQQSTPIERALASSTAPHLICDMWFSYKHARPMMTYSVPSTLGRF